MRHIADHGFEEGGFEDAVQGLVKSSPWWMISVVAHAIVGAILWSIPQTIDTSEPQLRMQAALEKKLEDPEEFDEEKPQPKEDEREIVENTIDPTDDPLQDDTDTIDFTEPEGEAGDLSGPLDSDYFNTSIGLRGGARGGKGKGGKGKGHGRYTRPTDPRMTAALTWLAIHQDVDTDGKWDCDDFMKHDPADDRCDGGGKSLYDTGVTGLALLAFLGAGHTDRGTNSQNPFARHVRKGLSYLITSQHDDGFFGSKASHAAIYNHAIATLAMCEAFWMTRNPRYKKPAQEGLNYLAMARNPYGAWRYEPRGGENDTSVTGWAVMALKAGKFAGLEVDPDAFEGARTWIDKVTDPNFGQVGYNSPGGPPARPEGLQDRFPPEKSQAMTAAGILSRIFLGEDPRKSEMIKKGADLLAEMPPKWNPDDGSIDMYYWYYGTLAMYQVGGSSWRRWNESLGAAIVETQHRKGSGARSGSWDPIGCWGDDGGRVYSTAVMAMCLQVYYRYDRVFGGGSR